MPQRKRFNVILDLDNTLISSVDRKEDRDVPDDRRRKFFWKEMLDANDKIEFTVFARPGLQEFLSWLFAHFNVSIWTAASKSYALFIVNEFVLAGRTDRKLDYVLFSYHCDESIKKKSFQKSLKMLSGDFFPITYDLSRTFIVDDSDEVFAAQPKHCLHVRPFDIRSTSSNRDSELAQVRRRLTELVR